jgi:hypothetical protein
MTLIAAFKCTNGYVICADTQETVDGYYRVSVEKLRPKKCGNFQIAIAGSGISRLVDDCARGLEGSIENATISTLTQLENLIRRKLESFNSKKFVCNVPIEDRPTFIITAQSSNPPSLQVWKTEISELNPISDDPMLAGWDHQMYIHIAQRLHSPTMSIVQGMFVGLYLLSIAENTSNLIRHPFTVIFANENGLQLQSKEDVDRWSQQIDLFSRRMDNLFLASIDPDISREDLQKSVFNFGIQIAEIRHSFAKEVTVSSTLQQEVLSPLKNGERGTGN